MEQGNKLILSSDASSMMSMIGSLHARKQCIAPLSSVLSSSSSATENTGARDNVSAM